MDMLWRAGDVVSRQKPLLNVYAECATAYSRSATELPPKLGLLSQREFQLVYDETEELRIPARESQEALLQHIAEHSC